MSLSDESAKESAKESSNLGRPDQWSDAQRRELFHASKDYLMTCLDQRFDAWVLQLGALVGDAAEQASDEQQRAFFRDVAPRFAVMRAQMTSRFESRYQSGIENRLQYLQARSDEAGRGSPVDFSFGGSSLNLMDDASLEEQLAVDELASNIRRVGGEEYIRWLTRQSLFFEHLGSMPELDQAHPLGAAVIARALIGALRVVTGERNGSEKHVWSVLKQWLRERLALDVMHCVDKTNHMLRNRGVLPSMGRVLLSETPDNVQISKAVSENLAPKSTASALQSEAALPPIEKAVISAAKLPTSELKNDLQRPNLERVGGIASAKSIEADAISFAHAVQEQPFSRAARRKYFVAVKHSVNHAHGLPSAPAVVDVVAALFDYAVDEERIAQSAKPLMWRLQQPVLVLALLDSRYLSQEHRSARELVENLSAISVSFAEDVSPGSELYQRMETAVRAVEIVASMLQSRAQVLAEQVDKHFAATAEQVAKISHRVANDRNELEKTPQRRNRRRVERRPGREREQAVTDRLQRELAEKMAMYSVPDSVGEFLRKVWLRHLRTAVLRDGEDSAEYRTAMAVVDDLLWSSEVDGPVTSRRQLSKKIPGLVGALTSGSKSTGANEIDYRAFFDELYLIHLRKLQPKADAAAAGEDSLLMGQKTLSPLQTQAPASPSTSTATVLEPTPVLSSSAPAPAQVQATFDAMAKTAQQLAQSYASATEEASANGPQHLLDILSKISLDDVAKAQHLSGHAPDVAMAGLEVGAWLQIDGAKCKLAWINSRRTVFLFLRHPDRRPLSLSAEDLLLRMRANLVGVYKD